ncbi:hypothetical protein PGT21_030894 [Puccinia graminis f. sp. tritici]|nr:hypothetical protein PGT21_030894 [Puccinia graminis f. sp. tritici]
MYAKIVLRYVVQQQSHQTFLPTGGLASRTPGLIQPDCMSFEITSSYIEAMHLITTTIVILSACGAAFGRLECPRARPHGMCGTPTPDGLSLIMSNLTPTYEADPLVYAGCQTTPYCGDDWMWKRVDAAMGSGEGIPKDATFDQHCQEMPK